MTARTVQFLGQHERFADGDLLDASTMLLHSLRPARCRTHRNE